VETVRATDKATQHQVEERLDAQQSGAWTFEVPLSTASVEVMGPTPNTVGLEVELQVSVCPEGSRPEFGAAFGLSGTAVVAQSASAGTERQAPNGSPSIHADSQSERRTTARKTKVRGKPSRAGGERRPMGGVVLLALGFYAAANVVILATARLSCTSTDRSQDSLRSGAVPDARANDGLSPETAPGPDEPTADVGRAGGEDLVLHDAGDRGAPNDAPMLEIAGPSDSSGGGTIVCPHLASGRPYWVTITDGTLVFSGQRGDPNTQTVVMREFEIGRWETTVGEYRQCFRARACSVPTAHEARGVYFDEVAGEDAEVPCLPMNGVALEEAEEYCIWAGGRLCTDSEWEFAARGAAGRPFPWGRSSPGTCERAWYWFNKPTDGAIVCGEDGGACGRKRPGMVCGLGTNSETKDGICDLAGNVAEWVSGFAIPGDGSCASGCDRPSWLPEEAAVRGGSYCMGIGGIGGTARLPMSQARPAHQLGIRCCRSLTPGTHPGGG
jgi:formylglycine-generating enzyme required for sulfatase activity